MRWSAFLTVLGAALVIASPLRQRDIEYDLVTEIVIVTVTEGDVKPPDPTTAIVFTTVYVDPVVTPTITLSPSPTVEPTPIDPPASTPAPPIVSSTTSSSSVTVPSSTYAVPPPNASPTDYISSAIFYHNVHRANHSAAAVTWDDTLASYAQGVAQTCVFAHNLDAGGGNYGQNIAANGGSDTTANADLVPIVGSHISNAWYYGEVNEFPFNTNDVPIPDSTNNVPDYLHFSQVVWKDTTTIGCFTQFCPAASVFPSDPSYFTVCNYGPAGNVGGEYVANVAEPGNLPPVQVVSS
ncbi:hypothetical protein B7494_g3186 [Chlorociboria aeruginascens]|nr:hypothetical protein B7494_g3186 [Chlorociboria aeruginascens]